MNKLTFFIVLTISLLLMNGCASKNMQADNSGFFKDYEQLKSTQTMLDISKYTHIKITPLIINPMIIDSEQTKSQKELYNQIKTYLNKAYKDMITTSTKLTLVDTPSDNTLILESAVSSVEVHLDDKTWNQHAPIPMGLNVISFNAYMDEDVRLLGEMRLVDAKSGDVVSRMMYTSKDIAVTLSGDTLTLDDFKPSLNAWVKEISKGLNK